MELIELESNQTLDFHKLQLNVTVQISLEGKQPKIHYKTPHTIVLNILKFRSSIDNFSYITFKQLNKYKINH